MTTRRPGPYHQRGASIFTTLFMLAVLGVLITGALKIAPVYLANNVVVDAVNGVIANNDVSSMSIEQVRAEVMRTVNLNNVEDFRAEFIQFTREEGMQYISVDYERRVPLFYNIDAVVSFQNRFER